MVVFNASSYVICAHANFVSLGYTVRNVENNILLIIKLAHSFIKPFQCISESLRSFDVFRGNRKGTLG